jgi:LemA protein
MKKGLIILGIAAAVLAIAYIGIYNGLVTQHENLAARWAQVENQLQRRYDLIPNLVNSVKGYAEHEKTVFEDITKARSAWTNAKSVDEKVDAAGRTDSALSRLIAVAENYPVLKADGTFLKLMDELSGTENRIAVERMRFNEAVRSYNTAIRMFPGSVIAGYSGFSRATEYFAAEQQAKAAPKVEF